MPLAVNNQRGKARCTWVLLGTIFVLTNSKSQSTRHCDQCTIYEARSFQSFLPLTWVETTQKFTSQSQGRSIFPQSSFRSKLSLVLGNGLWSLTAQMAQTRASLPGSPSGIYPQRRNLQNPHWEMPPLSPNAKGLQG